MKKLFVSLTLCLAILLSAFSVYAATFEDGVGKDEIPYCEYGNSYKPYSYTDFNMMTEDEAKAAGVPEGYSGYVLKLTGGASGMGLGLDLHEYKVKDIESITFRVWCPAGTKDNGVRLTDTDKDSWIVLANPGAREQWVDVVIDDESIINKLDDGNGYCKDVNFCLRYDASNGVAYIDAVTVKLRESDTTPPVITYEGETTVKTTEGKEFVLDLTAHDDYYDVDITPEYIWSEGALDGDGKLVKGTHTCTVKATDEAGNSSEISVQVIVVEKDTKAPELSYMPSEVYAPVGAKPIFKVTATDDKDEVEAELVWSNGALDARGRLTAGEHTLTVSATDLTGNKTEKVIIFIVGEKTTVGEIIVDTQ